MSLKEKLRRVARIKNPTKEYNLNIGYNGGEYACLIIRSRDYRAFGIVRASEIVKLAKDKSTYSELR